jgi:hypothetical protein
MVIFFVPLENGTGAHAKLLANLSGHGDLTLSGHF